ncbi:hypothetical protein KL86DPRO_11821 [uncultured delta proteobacterium]|uniref:Uncharacterized protein n=1 Tax=uncultured delta proteobacterium TaxID=34034 RepID=A0A212JML7_9DELT|nr:hypothetical protein KL86DPRO_11821 [uncultured delta proteobacterium]
MLWFAMAPFSFLSHRLACCRIGQRDPRDDAKRFSFIRSLMRIIKKYEKSPFSFLYP